MKYTVIDLIVNKWANEHSLHVYNEYRVSQIRSVELVSSGGQRRCQIWIDPPDEFGCVFVNVWNYGNRRANYQVSVEEGLLEALEDAYGQAMAWNSEDTLRN